MLKTPQRPKHIPVDFFNQAYKQIVFINDHVSSMEMDEKLKELNGINIAVQKEKIAYISSMISDNLILKDFYIQNQNNDDLFLDVMYAFESLPEWRNDYKTSGRQDYLSIQKMKKALAQCSDALSESPDVRLNVQMHWERYIRKIINSGCEKALTSKGRDVLTLAKNIIFPSFSNINKLREEGLVSKADSISFSRYQDFANFLEDMSEHLSEIEGAAKEKNTRVKKLNAQDAYVHYIVRRLKEVLEDHGVSSRKHVKYISDLVNGILGDNADVSEDRIRKLLP
jgi:hypothetical protein